MPGDHRAAKLCLDRPESGLSGWRDEQRNWPWAQTEEKSSHPFHLCADGESIGRADRRSWQASATVIPDEHTQP
jgi:hypothetical protein